MLALAGAPMGIETRFFDTPSAPGERPHPAAQVAPFTPGRFDDERAVREFARSVGVVTYEFENVPAPAALAAEAERPVFPCARALAIAQDRVAEKALFASLGIPAPANRAIGTRDEFERALADIGSPCILKTRRLGYDGKGQAVIRTAADAPRAWDTLGAGAAWGLVLEAFIPFSREVSMLAVRARDGETRFYPCVENTHEGGVLRRSLALAPPPGDETQRLAERHATRLLDALGYVGTLCVEFFETRDASGAPTLLANEIACRVHNSGHWTIEGAGCSQFENHLRAILGLPLGSTRMAFPGAHASMRNILGVAPTTEQTQAILRIEGARLHVYGKSARPGRKLGHVTTVAPDEPTLRARLGMLDLALGA